MFLEQHRDNINVTFSFQAPAAGSMARGASGTLSAWPVLKFPTAALAASRAWKTSAPHEQRQVLQTIMVEV